MFTTTRIFGARTTNRTVPTAALDKTYNKEYNRATRLYVNLAKVTEHSLTANVVALFHHISVTINSVLVHSICSRLWQYKRTFSGRLI